MVRRLFRKKSPANAGANLRVRGLSPTGNQTGVRVMRLGGSSSHAMLTLSAAGKSAAGVKVTASPRREWGVCG